MEKWVMDQSGEVVMVKEYYQDKHPQDNKYGKLNQKVQEQK